MQKQPNILVFMTDQQRGDSLTNPLIKMPNTRQLMSNGITFKNSYCPSPHCCPSRASFFTGLYPSQHGVWNNVCVQNTLSRAINPDTELFSHRLKEKNYSLYYAGKWHVCYDTGPEDHGFEELFVTCNKESKQDPSSQAMSPGWDMYRSIAQQQPMPRQEGEILRPGYPQYIHYGKHENPFNDQDVVNSALDKLHELRSSQYPWMMYVGTLGPHDPYFVPQEFLDMYQDTPIQLSDIHYDEMLDKPVYNRKIRALFDQLPDKEKVEAIRHYMAFCSYEDHLIGQVIDELKQHHQFDNTLILLLSDHGDYNGEHGLWCKGLPAFKSAYHIPAVAYWNNRITQPGGVVEDLVSLTDFAPTILHAANTAFKGKTVGQSLLPYLSGEKPATRDYLFTQTNGNEIYGIQRCVFNREWKLVHNTYDNDELYDLTQDPDELINIASNPTYKTIKEELYRQLWQFAAKTEDQSLNPYILVGMAEHGPAIAFQ